jgi:hypothetical protein
VQRSECYFILKIKVPLSKKQQNMLNEKEKPLNMGLPHVLPIRPHTRQFGKGDVAGSGTGCAFASARNWSRLQSAFAYTTNSV